MALEIEINPVTFITVGTIGPKGKRQFYLQGGDSHQTVSLTIEKEQARALAEAIEEMLNGIKEQLDLPQNSDQPDMSGMQMELREPVESVFRVAQIGLGYRQEEDLIILVAQEVVLTENEQAGVVRFWVPRKLMRALAQYTQDVVKQGRANPASNGRILYYWT
jgi:uncharacterized repeat protein (TIGR03847 family)